MGDLRPHLEVEKLKVKVIRPQVKNIQFQSEDHSWCSTCQYLVNKFTNIGVKCKKYITLIHCANTCIRVFSLKIQRFKL